MRQARPRRESYIDHCAPQIGQILQLLDRNPLSPTAGCFDRQYWHYRTMDFPCGMSQEFALPVALAYATDFPGNLYKGRERMREWAISAVDFARRSSHRDGSCDDYFPFERALGATVFSLYAMAETLLLLNHRDPALLDFLRRRARYAAGRRESGVLSNHHAIAAAALFATSQLTGDRDLEDAARAKAAEVLSRQHAEGWFLEYEGFDPGYQTVTVDFLARYMKASGDERVLDGLERAVRLLERVQHPDGTFGGEYGSRNTYHALPHGFEILAPRIPEARRVADRLLRGLDMGRRARNDDDRLVAHHVYPYLMAYRDFAPREGETEDPPEERVHLPGCGLFIDRKRDSFLIAGLSKGGCYRLYSGTELIANDSGPVLVLEDGSVLVSHLGHDAGHHIQEDGATCSTVFSRSERERLTPVKMVLLRLLMITFGRFFPDAVRKRLQKRLVTGRRQTPFRLTRTFRDIGGAWEVEDHIRKPAGSPAVGSIQLSVGLTSTATAASQPWEQGWLIPWSRRDRECEILNRDGSARILSRHGPPPRSEI